MFGIDEHDRIAFATTEFASQLETTSSHLSGTPLDIIMTADAGTDPLEVIAELRTAAAGQSRRCRVVLRRGAHPLTGTVEFTATDETRVIGRLCTEGRQDEQFRQLFEHSNDAIASFEMVEMTPVVRSVNTAFVDTFGYEPSTIVGESLNEYIVPDERTDEATDYDKRTALGETYQAVVTRKTVSGRRKFTFRSLTYERHDGRRYGFAIYSDVTDDRLRRRELQVLHRVLRHNLRNDLSVVVGMADHIQEVTDQPETQQAASKILTAAKRLNSVSEQARNVETALDNKANRTVDVANLVRSVAAEYDDVQTDIPQSAPVAGSIALYDAVDNLVENAAEHTPPGTDIWVTIDDENDETFVRVSDDGPGIPETERDVIFGDADITTLTHGSGLGLWLARWVAEAAGGELRYDRFNGWTAVTLWLPRTDAATGEVLTTYRNEQDDPAIGKR